jgi:two-component system cell cycle sensor histidine kinase/response regulator CckA
VAIEDISARRLAEDAVLDSQARFSTFAREAPVGIIQSDEHGDCVFANAEACRIAGVTPEEALGQGWTRHVHPDDLALLKATRGATMESGKGFALEFRFQFPDSAVVWAHTISIQLHDHGGGTTGFLGAITDVTERKRLEEELRQSQKMEAIGRLAGGVAHDFNNMLTVITGYASQLLTSVAEGHPARKAAEQIRNVGDQAAMLTRQLLAFSRKQILRPGHINLNEVLRALHDLLVRLLGESIEVAVALDPKLSTVVADAGQIHQVILNLAINARDAMPHGGRLTLTTANVSLDETRAHAEGLPEGDYVTLSVTDTGVGMEARTRERLFEPFFTTKPPGSGTGLGLSMVFGIVQQSGGTIQVESEPRKGTTFRIFLPRAAGEIEPSHAEAAVPIKGGDETILLVEDAAVVRSLVRELLEQRGYTVLEARDGGEALTMSENHDGPIHLLLTDLLMPRMGGHELAKRIRRRRPGVRVIYMSGYSGEALHAVEKEANFLEKPFKPDGLAAAVRKVLDKP